MIGLQHFSLAIFLMDDRALEFFRQARGWDIGVEARLVAGRGGLTDATTLAGEMGTAYAITFDERGALLSLALSPSSSLSSHRRRHPRAPQRHAHVGGEPDDDLALGDVPGRDRASQGAAAAFLFASFPSPLVVLRPRRGRFGTGRGVDDEADADVGMAARGAEPVDERGASQVDVISDVLLLLLGGRDRKKKDQKQ